MLKKLNLLGWVWSLHSILVLCFDILIILSVSISHWYPYNLQCCFGAWFPGVDHQDKNLSPVSPLCGSQIHPIYEYWLDIHIFLFFWCNILSSWLSYASQVRIAMVGKYTGLSDAYLSVLKVHYITCVREYHDLIPVWKNIMILCTWLFLQALSHASVAYNRELIVEWVPAGDLEDVTANKVVTDLSSALF